MSSTPLEIRPVSAANHAAWLPLWQGYQQFYKTAIAEETSAVTWQRFLDPAEPMHAALAWREGRAVGLVHWIFHRSCWTVGDYCYLQDLYVAEGLRGEGVGRQLIEHVYAQARAAGASRVHWLTHETNTDAMQVYDRIADRSGFIQYRKLL
ncbi:GNAT family N-acetyltransferase [Pseudomonas boanensis]|uniref:GNAT family N-acetyltransferase n=1 Tax=Metapseudomonas boanensis TaxID=2822138 RepID=UPI0035D47601